MTLDEAKEIARQFSERKWGNSSGSLIECREAARLLLAHAERLEAALREVAHHADDECGFMVNVRKALGREEPPDA